MIFQKTLPHPQLRHFVAYYWTLSSTVSEEGKTYRFIPDTFVEWVFHLQAPWQYRFAKSRQGHKASSHLLGHFRQYMDLELPESSFQLFGVKFHPAAARLFWKIDMKESTDAYINLEELKIPGLKILAEQLQVQSSFSLQVNLMDKFLLKVNVDRQHELESLTNQIYKDGSIRNLFNRGLSKRRIEQRFQQEIGISPKLFQRTIRINQVIKQILQARQHSLTDIAYQFNYADQSHFINDFKQFTGVTPSSFLKKTNPHGDIFNLTLES